MSSKEKALVKPLMRGYSHQAAFFIALIVCSFMLSKTHGTKEFLAFLIYSISLCAMFGISALYHRPTWKPEARMWMRRLDHAAIYILIAGTSTPICVIALPPATGIKLLQLVWGAAFFGIFQSLFWAHWPKWISSTLYVIVGCLVVPFLPELRSALTVEQIRFIITGGALYIVGAIIYALRRPNPSPKYFGYHEIFHLLVIAGAIFHYLAVSKLLN